MKCNIKVYLLIPAVVSLLMLGSSCQSDDGNPLLKQKFNNEISKALKLKYLYSDSIYDSNDIRIFNDTIVGYYVHRLSEPGFYFIQSLKNPSFVKIIKRNILEAQNAASCSTCTTRIEQLKDGCLYFPKFGGNTLVKLCNDSTAEQYFNNYQNVIFYANRTLFYKKLVIISSFSGMYIFDMSSQLLVWKQTYGKFKLNYGLVTTVGNKLIYTWEIETDKPRKITTYISCIDLDNFSLSWQKALPNDLLYATPFQENQRYNQIISNQLQQIVVPTRHQFQIIDANSGSIQFSISINDISSTSPNFVLDNDQLFINYNSSTSCYNLKNKRKIWQLPNFYLLGAYKSCLIGVSKDQKKYRLALKSTGKVFKEIQNPNLKKQSIRFIDKYLIVNDHDLYQ